MTTDGEDRVARVYRDGYGRIPGETPDDWGDLESFHDELAFLRDAIRSHE